MLFIIFYLIYIIDCFVCNNKLISSEIVEVMTDVVVGW